VKNSGLSPVRPGIRHQVLELQVERQRVSDETKLYDVYLATWPWRTDYRHNEMNVLRMNMNALALAPIADIHLP
jgi:hypothetical protein